MEYLEYLRHQYSILYLIAVIVLIHCLKWFCVSANAQAQGSVTLDAVAATSVPSLNSQTTATTPVSNLSSIPPASDLVADEDNPYSNAKDDLQLYHDGHGGYIAVVYTPNGFLDAIYDPAAKGWSWDPKDWKSHIGGIGLRLSGMKAPFSDIHKIILAKDINMNDIDKKNNPYDVTLTSNGSNGTGIVTISLGSYRFVHVRHNQLDIDGNGHYINMMSLDIALSGTQKGGPEPIADYVYKEDWTLENTTVYSISYWGYLSANTGLATNYEDEKTKASGLNGGYTWFTYKNMNFVGAQFAWTVDHTTGVTIEGNVNVNTCYSYTVPHDNHVWHCEGDGNQQNFEVDRVVFKNGCHYQGYSFNGVIMELTGKATFEDGSRADFYPHGSSPEYSAQGMSFGIYMPSDSNANSTIEMNGDSELDIHCNTIDYNPLQNGTTNHGVKENHRTFARPCGALDMESKNARLLYNKVAGRPSPRVHIDSYGQIIGNKALVYFNSGEARLANGNLNIKAYELGKYNTSNGSYGGGLMKVGTGMHINVLTGGNFSLEVADKKHDANSPLNLLYASGKIDINIVNPANVTLDLTKDNCNASALVYTQGSSKVTTMPRDYTVGNYTIPKGTNVVLPPSSPLNASNSNSDIHLYDTKIKAWGDNGAASGNGAAIKGPAGGGSQTIKVGYGTDGPVRVQRAELPFTKNLIDPLLYADNTKIIQATDRYGLAPLKDAMFSMLGKQFRYINFSDLPGPSLKLNSASHYLYPSRGNQAWNIQGASGGDEWQDYTVEQNLPEFLPNAPLVRVQIKRPNSQDSTKFDYYDLGTQNNPYEAEQKANAKMQPDDIAKLVNPVTPNILDDNLGNLSLYTDDHSPNPNLGHSITKYQTDNKGNPTKDIVEDFEEKHHPKYLAAIDVNWDNLGYGNDWNSSLSGPGAWGNFKHTISYNLSTLLSNYNRQHPASPLYLQSDDQILTSVVANFQSSPISVTYARPLTMKVGPKQTYLLGDTVKLPLSYYDGDQKLALTPDQAKLHLEGQIKDGDAIQGDINKIILNKKTAYEWNIGTATQVGEHQVQFTAHDNANPDNYAYDDSKNTTTSSGDTFTWNYEVLDLPAYTGVHKVTDNPYENSNPRKIITGQHKLKTTFKPKDKAPVHSIKVIHDNKSDLNCDKVGHETITASYLDPKTNKQRSATIAFSEGKVYSAGDFFDDDMEDFPEGTQFVIDRHIQVEADSGEPVKIAKDTLISVAKDQTQQDLGSSKALFYNMSGTLNLEVPHKIDYGIHNVKTNGVIPIQQLDGDLKIINETNNTQNVKLTAKVTSEDPLTDNLINKYLRYQADNQKYNFNSKILYQDDVDPDLDGVNLSADWFDNSGNQVEGPVLDISSDSTLPHQKYQAKIQWTLVSGL